MFGAEGETLVLNAGHPLVAYITGHEDGRNVKMLCEQLYDLAKLQNAPLSAEAMTKFIARSNEIMMLMAKENRTAEPAQPQEDEKKEEGASAEEQAQE